MANPVVFTIPVSTWVKVATAVFVGNILPIEADGKYLYTYRMTGGAAPTNGDYSDAKELAYEGGIIQSSAAIDVYVAVTDATDDGHVRVDL